MEQQLGEKPPRTSTCPLEENPGPAEPPNQRPPGAGSEQIFHFTMARLKCFRNGQAKLFLKILDYRFA